MPPAIDQTSDDARRVQGSVELGPRSMALLRRLVLAAELLLDTDIPDPGGPSEQEASPGLAP
jgi:hypothetical protein